MLTYLLLILGFIFLIKGAQLLIDGAAALAKKFNISELVIGLTIVAFGTSAPELFINLISNFKGAADIGVGNILGANISAILLVCGLSAMIYPITVKKAAIKKEIPIGLIAILILFFLANNFFIGKTAGLSLGRIDGAILLFIFAVYLYFTVGLAKDGVSLKNKLTPKPMNNIEISFHLLAGIVGLALGGQWVVGSASQIAFQLGFSQALIGLTVVAIGTTLPELFASATAAFKKDADLAIGNIIGSVVLNVSLILGFSSFLKPMIFDAGLNLGVIICFAVLLLLFYFIITGKKERRIEHWEGVALFCGYLIYLAFLVVRG